MKSLPKTWRELKIERLLQRLPNGNVVQQGWSPQCEKIPSKEGEWGVLKTTAIQDGFFLSDENKRLPSDLAPKPGIEVEVGDILMTCAGPRNRCGVACSVKATRSKLMMSGKMYRFRANKDAVDPKYLEYFLQSQQAKRAIDRMKTGINDSGLNLTHDRFVQLVVPVAPLPEQQRIVMKIEELLSELEESIKCLRASERALETFLQSTLNASFNPINDRRPLASLLTRKLTNGYSGKPVAYETDTKVLGLSSTTSGTFLDSHWKYLDEKGLDKRDIWCAPDDILIQRGNTIEYVGVPAIYTGKPNAFIFPDLMIRAKANTSLVLTKYLYYALSSPKIRNLLRQKAKGSAGTMPKINQEILSSLPIPYCDIEHQKTIVQDIERTLSLSESVRTQCNLSGAQAGVLRYSILERAFAGDLVAQRKGEKAPSEVRESKQLTPARARARISSTSVSA